jgi:hypothetical protein
MSAPNEGTNPWVSLAELLKSGISEAVLASAIEMVGIQTYDRFGRRVTAKDDGSEPTISKARALDLLAEHYSYLTKTQIPDDLASDNLISEETDFYEFGWPKDELPNFDGIESENTPRMIRGKKLLNIDGNVSLPKHRSYLLVIGSLFNLANRNKIKGKEVAYSHIVIEVEKMGSRISIDTVENMFKDLPNAIEARSR